MKISTGAFFFMIFGFSTALLSPIPARVEDVSRVEVVDEIDDVLASLPPRSKTSLAFRPRDDWEGCVLMGRCDGAAVLFLTRLLWSKWVGVDMTERHATFLSLRSLTKIFFVFEPAVPRLTASFLRSATRFSLAKYAGMS